MNSLSTKKGRISWPEASSMKQIFSLPDAIIYYILKNPASPEIYLKLAQSCKYFFEKNPILVVRNIFDGGRKFCAVKNHGWNKNSECCVKFDICKLSSKIWLTYELIISEDIIPNAATLFSTKIYRCENAQLLFYSNTNISFEDFKIWSTIFQKFDIYYTNVININGINASLYSVLEVIPNVHTFYYHFLRNTSAVTASTIKDITKLKNLDNLYKFVLYNIPEIVNVEDLGEFIQNHKETKFWLDFDWNISEEYKIRLDKLVDAIIESSIPHRALSYKGQNEEKYKVMRNRYIY